MKKTHSGSLAITLIAVLVSPSTGLGDTDPQLLKLGVKVYQAIGKAKKALNDIKKVEEVVKDIEAGRSPSVTENKWADLANSYREAAKELKEAPLPTDFDQTKYKVSLDELMNCTTRDGSLFKLKGFLKELKDAQERGQSANAELDLALSEADEAREALRYLIKVHEKLTGVPFYGSVFTWDWFELNTDVSASLGELTSALKSHRKKINDELGKLKQYIPNLEGNLTSLGSLGCGLEGTWTGNWTWTVPATEGRDAHPELKADGAVTIIIRRESGQLAGDFQFRDYPKLKLENINVNGDKLTFAVTDTWPGESAPYRLSFSMSLTNSSKTMSGTLSQSNRPHWKNSTATLMKN